jgi:hypothetical protein
MSGNVTLSMLLGCPTEVPALFATFEGWTTEQLCYAVRHDLKVCGTVPEHHPEYKDAQHIIEHLTIFANEELERRGLEAEF